MKKIIVIGNLGSDAVVRDVNGSKFVSFNIAVTEKYRKDDGPKVEKTTWFSCTHNNIKLAEYLLKGAKVYIEGNFNLKMYVNNSGKTMSQISITIDRLEFLSAAKKENENSNPSTNTANEPDTQPEEKEFEGVRYIYDKLSGFYVNEETGEQLKDDLPF